MIWKWHNLQLLLAFGGLGENIKQAHVHLEYCSTVIAVIFVMGSDKLFQEYSAQLHVLLNTLSDLSDNFSGQHNH